VVAERAAAADIHYVGPFTIECLRCGHAREFLPGPTRSDDVEECPRCGYAGWAYSNELSERTRRRLRDVPVEHRRIRTL
jgi:Zn ribbon nucleic-acid-binding protein